MKVKRIDHINIRIPLEGINDALNFYKEVLGLETKKLEAYKRGERTSFFMKAGPTSMINIRPKEGFEQPNDTNFDHFCLVTEDYEKTKEKIKESDVEIIRKSNPTGSKGRNPSIYIRDPFNYKIEIKKAHSQ